MEDYDDLSTGTILEYVKKLQQKIQHLEELEKSQREYQHIIQENASKLDKIVEFNVRGTLFALTKTSLLKYPNTYFHALFSSNMHEKIRGAYFIDCSPQNFSIIIDFINSDDENAEISHLTKRARELLRLDFDYFGLPPPSSLDGSKPSSNKLIFDKAMCSSNARITYETTTVKYLNPGAWNCGVLGSRQVDRFKIQVINRGTKGYFMIGFAPKIGFQLNDMNHRRYGYYYHGQNGDLYSQAGHQGAPYGAVLGNGDIIESIYDKGKSEISFIVNGKNFGAAFKNVSGDLFPALDLADLVELKLIQ